MDILDEGKKGEKRQRPSSLTKHLLQKAFAMIYAQHCTIRAKLSLFLYPQNMYDLTNSTFNTRWHTIQGLR